MSREPEKPQPTLDEELWQTMKANHPDEESARKAYRAVAFWAMTPTDKLVDIVDRINAERSA